MFNSSVKLKTLFTCLETFSLALNHDAFGKQTNIFRVWKNPECWMIYRNKATVTKSGNLCSPVATGNPDSPGSIDVFTSFPRVLRRWPHPLRVSGLWTLLRGLTEPAGRCHLSLHVHGRGCSVGRFEYGLILTHYRQCFLPNRATAVSVCHQCAGSQSVFHIQTEFIPPKMFQ